MNRNPYAAPQSRVTGAEPAPPPLPRPRQVTLAYTLGWVSLGLGIPTWYLTLLRDPESGASPGMLVFVAIVFALSATLNVQIYRGRNWARMVTLVLDLLTAASFLLPAQEPIPPGAIEQGFNLLTFVLELATLYLIFSMPGALWFRPRAQ